MSRTRYRIVLSLLGVVFVAVVVAAVLLTPGGTPTTLPPHVVEVSPADGALVLRRTKIVLRLDPAYRASFVVDGVPVPDDEVTYVPGTGLHVFAPGPGKVLETWTPGVHVVEARWDTTSGLPDPGSLRWSFRVE